MVQIGARLEELEICTNAAFVRDARQRALLDELGITGESAEGYLFPASYDFLVNSRPTLVITTMVRELHKRFERVRARHPGALERLQRDLRFSAADVLTLASIVEKETAHADERPLIASVFYNRLQNPAFVPSRMLQSDPTAAYGCTIAPNDAPSCASYRGRVTPAMLRDAANRYNTYRHTGLPPGPIANPGEPAIEAVLAPAQTDYLFFVANASGRHTFSRTFEEHAKAIRTPKSRSPAVP
jgi:UPF0755 protein